MSERAVKEPGGVMVDDAGARLDAAAAAALADGVPDSGVFDVERAPLGPHVHLDVLARRVPKAELHLHLAGAVRPSTTARLAAERGRDLAGPLSGVTSYRGFGRFGEALRFNTELLDTPAKVTAATLEVLADAVDNGCRHVELMVTVPGWAGLEPPDLLRAVGAAFALAERYWSTTGGIIVDADRGLGPDAAVEAADVAGDAADAGVPVLGYGNDGDPLAVPFADLRPGYERARARGLRLCGHVDLPEDLGAALEFGVDRIDHGYVAIFQPDLLAEVVARRIPLTVCVTSNLVQMPGIFPDWTDHPVHGLLAAGAHVTLNTDDPPYFFTDLAQEYRSAAVALGWDAAAMAGAARRSLEAAWMPASTRDATLARLFAEIDDMVADPRLTTTAGRT